MTFVGRHHSPRRAGTSSHAGLMCRAGEVEQVGLTGVLAGHTPSRQEAIIPLWAVLVELTSWTQPVCKRRRGRCCINEDFCSALLTNKQQWKTHPIPPQQFKGFFVFLFLALFSIFMVVIISIILPRQVERGRMKLLTGRFNVPLFVTITYWAKKKYKQT